MAAGALDSNGIWQYGEDDERDTFSELLNIGQDATSDAIGADRARLAALEATGVLGAVTVGVVTAAANWAVSTNNGRKKNGLAFVELLFTRTTSGLTVPANGDLANTDLATFNPGWAPAPGMAYPAASRDGRISAYSLFSGGIQIVYTTQGGTNIATGEFLRVTAIYPLA